MAKRFTQRGTRAGGITATTTQRSWCSKALISCYELLVIWVSLTSVLVGGLALGRKRTTTDLDLRLELGGAVNDLGLIMVGFETYLEHAYKSHVRVLAATGSGEMRLSEEEFTNDRQAADRLKAHLLRVRESCDNYSTQRLEAELLATDRFRGEARKLRDKYASIVRADDQRRAALRRSGEEPACGV